MGLAYKLDGVNWDAFICPNSPKTAGKSLLSVLFFSENSVLFNVYLYFYASRSYTRRL